MSVKDHHPDYAEYSLEWALMRDSYKGQRKIKAKGSTYLMPTSGHYADGFPAPNTAGTLAYNAYKGRARYWNFLKEAVGMAVGMMHSQPAVIELPDAMKDIKSRRGETLQQLLVRINTEQLITGRIGLMADLPTKAEIGKDIPYLATYNAEKIINWDDGSFTETVPHNMNLVVLDESQPMRTDTFNWETKDRYRVLMLGELGPNESKGIYAQGIFDTNTDFDVTKMKAPNWRGRQLEKIPFVFINACDIVAAPDDPPLLDLANLCITLYQGDADYRQNLFMQGQDTLVTMGANFESDDNVRVGTGARLDLPTGADAKYVGVQSQGLSEQRQSVTDLRGQAGSMGAQTLDTTSRERESGDSLRIRVAARTADMNQLADAGAAGLEQILKDVAVWMGENPEEVKVTPNKEFGEAPLTGQTMVEMATARNLGWPMSARSMHNLSRKRKLTNLSFEEELAQAKKEVNTLFSPADNGDRNPDQVQGNGAPDNNEE
jgi:hypothetical protein